jgi:hypothetical protein
MEPRVACIGFNVASSAQNSDQQTDWATAKTDMNLRVPWKFRNISSKWRAISFSTGTLFQGARYLKTV